MAKTAREERLNKSSLNAISLFTGAGGLDIGLEKAGYEIKLCIENDEYARRTLKWNRPAWRLSDPGDIHLLSPASILSQAGLSVGELKLLAGGPPCQPFSKSSYWVSGDSLRLKDPRAKTLRAFLC